MNNYWIFIQIAVLIITGLITASGTIAVTTWKVSRFLSAFETNITKLINDHQLSDNIEFNKIRKEIDESGDTLRHEFGETATSLRTHLHNIQLDISDNKVENLETFIKRTSFYEVVKEMNEDIKQLIRDVAALIKASRK